MAELFAARFKATTVFGIDLADILTSEMEDQRLLQEKRASERLWIELVDCLTANNSHFGQWVDEAPRIMHRMGLADRKGGKSVWQRRFLSLHSPLLMDNHNYGLLASGHKTRVGNELDPAGARYRSAFLQDVNYRLTREGVLVATYEVDFRAASYAIPDVINALNVFREDSFNTFQRFLADYFGDQQRRTLAWQSHRPVPGSRAGVRQGRHRPGDPFPFAGRGGGIPEPYRGRIRDGTAGAGRRVPRARRDSQRGALVRRVQQRVPQTPVGEAVRVPGRRDLHHRAAYHRHRRRPVLAGRPAGVLPAGSATGHRAPHRRARVADAAARVLPGVQRGAADREARTGTGTPPGAGRPLQSHPAHRVARLHLAGPARVHPPVRPAATARDGVRTGAGRADPADRRHGRGD